VRYLLESGADANARDLEGRTPLMVALLKGRTDWVRRLLAVGADATLPDAAGKSALERPDPPGFAGTQEARQLLKAFVDNVYRFPDNQISVYEKAASGTAPMVAELFKTWPKLDARPLLFTAAAHNPAPEVVAALLAAGADANLRDRAGMTPLLYAVKRNPRAAVVAKLLDLKGNPDLADPQGRPALVLAAAERDAELVHAILSTGAHPDVLDADLRTALWVAASRKDADMVAVLLAAGASIQAADSNGQTPLIAATAAKAPVALIEQLLKAGADPLSRDDFGLAAYDYAVKNNDRESARVLYDAEWKAAGVAEVAGK
jgi:ankyrin repeat protein